MKGQRPGSSDGQQWPQQSTVLAGKFQGGQPLDYNGRQRPKPLAASNGRSSTVLPADNSQEDWPLNKGP